MFLANVFDAKKRRLAEKWTSPRPPRERLRDTMQHRAALVCVICTLVATLVGCGRGGPERAIVSGAVAYQGQPVKEGQIRFFPIQGTRAPMSGAQIADGQYAVEAKGGVVIGTYRVEITAYRPDPKFRELTESLPPDATELERPPQQQYLPAKYNTQSELEFTVPPGSKKIAKDFELAD